MKTTLKAYKSNMGKKPQKLHKHEYKLKKKKKTHGNKNIT